MSIIHAQSVIGASGQNVTYTVALGVDMAETGAHATDASVGFRLKFNANVDGIIQDAHNPAGGGLPGAADWAEDRNPVTPSGFTCSLFEYQWVQFSKDPAITSVVSPVAQSTFDTWDADKVWTAEQTTGAPTGGLNWVIDITLREIANTANTDTIRWTGTVELL